MHWVIGIDGGATHTAAALCALTGGVVARARADMMLPAFLPMVEVEVRCRAVVEDLLRQAQGGPKDVGAICLGMSGCDRPTDREGLESMARRILPDARAAAVSDALVALVGGCGELDGIIVISGTGSIAYGFTPDGRMARAGGLGHLLSDEGSGYAIGLGGLRAIVHAADGRGPATALTDRILGALNLRDFDEIVPWSRSQGLDKANVAALAPEVFEAAGAGDAVAEAIVKEAARDLALAAQVVARRLWTPETSPTVVAAGSNLQFQSLLFSQFVSEVAARCPRASVIHPRDDPAVGACVYALKLLGCPPNVGGP